MTAVRLSTKAVGSIVKIKVNNVLRDFIVVHQGKPSAMYDDSCDGTWLLMKDLYESRQWHSSNENNYTNSTIHSYLNSTFLNLFDVNIKNAIKQIKIPYCPGKGSSYTVNSGANGLATKIFLLSGYEMGWTSSDNDSFNADGAKVSYFDIGKGTAANNKRVGYHNGTPATWWLRSMRADSSGGVWYVNDNGTFISLSCSNSQGVRPAFVLTHTPWVNDDGTITVNTAPTTPSSITVPTTVKGGKSLAISWGASTDPDGNLTGYRLERQYNEGAWTQIYQGANQSYTDNLTHGWISVRYRVKAYDSYNEESGYITSDPRAVFNNYPPVISGSNASLGTFLASPPMYNYTVTDPNNDVVTVVETLNGAMLRTYTATLGATNTLTFTADAWRKMLNGNYTLTITATDPHGGTTTQTLAFVKAVTEVQFMTVPLVADVMPTKSIVNIQGNFPIGSNLILEVCNNGNDPNPTWEDITTKALNNQKHFFANNTKTTAQWGVRLRVKLSHGSAAEACYIQSIGGNFA